MVPCRGPIRALSQRAVQRRFAASSNPMFAQEVALLEALWLEEEPAERRDASAQGAGRCAGFGDELTRPILPESRRP